MMDDAVVGRIQGTAYVAGPCIGLARFGQAGAFAPRRDERGVDDRTATVIT
jgi:hypothetical protein